MNDSNGNATSPLPCIVSIPPFAVNHRRLSSSTVFVQRSRPVSSEKQMAWISLQGRLVNADEASSARTIGGGLTDELAFAWNLFPPIHRVLIVAVIGTAASVARSQKNQEILKLKKSIELRDQVLLSMQEKLDDLCEQVNRSEENTVVAINKLSNKDGELQLEEAFGSERIKFVDCGCWHCEEHSSVYNELVDANSRKASSGNEVLQYKSRFSNEEQEERRMSDWSDLASSVTFTSDIQQGANSRKASSGNVVLQYKSPFSNEEQEERRMSDWSDLASSVTSAADSQLNNLAIEQDIYNLKRDCEEKETTINELTTLLNSSEIANRKRVAELEDTIERKNTTISKLKKDMAVLEQKVMQLTRLRRPSFSANILNESQLPQMRDNLIYDMDSTTSPSSSDSDSSPVNNTQNLPANVFVPNQNSDSTIDQTPKQAKFLKSSGTLIERRSQSRYASPLQEVPIYHKSNAASSSSQKQLSPHKDLKKSRRRSLTGAKTAGAHKRWV
ncbi:uncharacterized protein LOC127087245 isoform X3 [Lathyrus oleraceus]|uniref:uncharacterized protein LOC127087245 isoform X3 n=1 Tax=Pisum sativum TaxID=3888 RepID=UPI0021CED5AF|nr:uncharacterized protein LOC127087245 isoform X3 [Pisum sativum]